jgi:tetratricopeptide (TPR) repeat protein
MQKLKLNLFLILIVNIILFTGKSYSQDIDIVPYLKAIENGNLALAKENLSELKEKNPDDPSVMFLDAVLKENGQEAIVIYQDIVDNHPKSKYADASLYRIFSYYYALGLYDTAQEKLKQLQVNYPTSPYIQVAEQNISALEKSEETKTETRVEESQTKTEEDYKFTIQAGAFTNLENAKKLIGEFEDAGIFSQLGEKVVGGTTFHIVYAGKFQKQADAESFLQVLSSRYKINGTIVSPPGK